MARYSSSGRIGIGVVCRSLAAVVGSLLFMAVAAFGQTNVEATITGVVTDESGAVLPGVSVTATSPSLPLGQLTTVTDASGEYRLNPLPLGTYEVTYALQGFQSVKRENVRLTVGFTARIDIPMKLGSLSETITVSGASPVVDVASSTPTTALTQETLELVPTSRNGVQALMAQAPGTRTNVDVGGNTVGAIPVFRAFGNSASSWPVVEGMAVLSPSANNGYSGIYNDYSSFQEVQVSSVGNDAETPGRGIFMNMVVKSGGNAFHGSLAGNYTNPSLISNNVDAALKSEGIVSGVPIERRYDYGGDLGGFLVRDKIWFYVAARQRQNDNFVLDCTQPGGAQCDATLAQKFYSGKVTYQVNSANKLIAYYQRNLKDNMTGESALVNWDSRFTQSFTGNLGKAEYQGTLGKNIVVDGLVGLWNFNSWQYGNSNLPSSIDLGNQERSGSSTLTYYTPDDYIWAKIESKGTISWYKPSGFLGDHNVKAGFDYIKGWTKVLYPEHANGDYEQEYLNGAPYELAVFNLSANARNDDRYYATFVEDEWRTSSRLTLNVGTRVAFDRGFLPAQTHTGGQFAALFPSASYPRINVTSWNTVAPRLHATYALTKDDKTVIKGGWGRFVGIHGADDAAYLNKNEVTSDTFLWHVAAPFAGVNCVAAETCPNYQPGQVDLTPNGPNFVSSTGTVQGLLNPNERPPLSDEFSLSIERELAAGFAVRLTGIYSRDHGLAEVINPLIPFSAYTIPTTNPNPFNPGQTITYWNYPTSLRGAAFQANERINDPLLTQIDKSFEVAASKRLSKKWLANASYAYTKLYQPGANAGANPNNQINTLNHTHEWSAKASGSYQLPFGVQAGSNLEVRSGQPWQETALFTGGVTIPSIVLPVQPLGAQYYANLWLFDGRLRKEFRLVSNHKISAGVDVFNLLNKNTVTAINTRFGPTFGNVTTAAGNTATLPFLPGRDVQLVLSYTF
jgi:hypothetical protein